MLSRNEFIRYSLEINLFFQRIMKEHMFLIETNLTPVEAALIEEAKGLKMSFEEILAETVAYADGRISENAIESNEIVTPYTLRAEKVTSVLTGASIDTNITKAELQLRSKSDSSYEEWMEDVVFDINRRSLNLLNEVIAFKDRVITMEENCEIFITLYHELVDHLIHEAMYYQEVLRCLQRRSIPEKTLCDELNFWNNIMAEHAQFIDGLLDPTEKELKDTAENFAEKFERLVEICLKVSERQVIQKSTDETGMIRDFKRAATEGLLECNIKSIIPPLLADHVLREANHYYRLLRMLRK